LLLLAVHVEGLVREFTAAPVQARIAVTALALALAISAVTDLRERRILNAVCYPTLLIAAVCAFSLGGLPLLLESALGALVCATPLALAMWRGWMGAGDVKLMAVAGLVSATAAGWTFSLIVLLDVAVAGGAQAALWLLAAKARRRARPKAVPYGVAIAVGTTWAFLTGALLF
jgi:Flp pilus assembly protein protease CpaA